jgi:hypothetical protein
MDRLQTHGGEVLTMANAVYAMNRRCTCGRCRSRSLIGSAMLITVGVLMLLDQNGIVSVEQSWPVMLLVLGAFVFLSRTASMEGHFGGAGAAAMTIAQPGSGTWAEPEAGAPESEQNYTSEPEPDNNDREVKQ